MLRICIVLMPSPLLLSLAILAIEAALMGWIAFLTSSMVDGGAGRGGCSRLPLAGCLLLDAALQTAFNASFMSLVTGIRAVDSAHWAVCDLTCRSSGGISVSLSMAGMGFLL